MVQTRNQNPANNGQDNGNDVSTEAGPAGAAPPAGRSEVDALQARIAGLESELAERNHRSSSDLAALAARYDDDGSGPGAGALQSTGFATQVPHSPENHYQRAGAAREAVMSYRFVRCDPESQRLLEAAGRGTGGGKRREAEVRNTIQVLSYLFDLQEFLASPTPAEVTAEELKQDLVAAHDHVAGLYQHMAYRLEELELDIYEPNNAAVVRAYAERHNVDRRSRMSARGQAIRNYVDARVRSSRVNLQARDGYKNMPSSAADQDA